ncbi:hypothetical protein COLO4_31339 [Corchorus olitorius]|uniref:Uncharacterized protein n=1 Tax=Corchorus olitorius TaxID=93759 RepID=A0A1R3H4N4_9ROSI|nr:hypothetical protein COLO4_31339 [Corchorus olitorius]
MTTQPRSTATDEMNTTVHQASQDATGDSVEAAASGSFIFNGSGQQTMSTHFSFSATVSSNGTMPASVSSQVTAEGPTVTTVQPQQQPRQTPTHASASCHVTTSAQPSKSTFRPLPSILRMPPRTGDCSWVDGVGNHHGLKRGRSSPASVAKFKKPTPTAQNIPTNQASKGPVRRSPRNMQKGSGSEVISAQDNQSAMSKGQKGKKKLF